VGFAVLIRFFELSHIELDIGFSFLVEAMVLELRKVETQVNNILVLDLLSFSDLLF